MRLNPAQQAAVEYISGPCLVLAGAGSGKTRVITNKIAYLVNVCKYKPSQIAAVTFTNKAAREMKERVSQTLGKKESRGLKVSTFHTMGLSIIKKHLTTLGYKAGFSLFDDKDSYALLNDLSSDEYAGDKDQLSHLQRSISNWKNELIMPLNAVQMYEKSTGIEAEHAKYYQEYSRHMQAYNALDFDDLILLPTVLLQQHQTIREKWQNTIRYLLVDEYQDTNTSQYQLVRLLVGERARFTVVGDDDQSIYSWRGAQPKNLSLLKEHYPQLKLVKLEQNYRSSQRILHSANILIQNNPHLFDKRLFSELGQGEKLKVLIAKNEDHEADKVTAELMAHKFMNNTKYKDYAILYRGNHQSRVFEKVLMKNRIPYKISGGSSFFGRAEVKDTMAYLRVLTNQSDDNAILRIINTPARGIGRVTLAKIGEFANQNGGGLFEAMSHPHINSVLGDKAGISVQHFTRLIATTSDNAARGETQDVLRDFIKALQYEEYLYALSASPKAAEIAMKNVATLFGWVQDLLKGDALNAPMTLPEVVQRLTLRDMMERGEDDAEADQVQLMTLHASKGLEFPYVFMVGMEEGLLPHQSSIDEDNVDEERRLAYVGITRAQKQLYFSIAKERRQYGETIEPTPSRFLYELPVDDLEWEWQKKPDSEEVRQEKTARGIAALKKLLED